MAKHTVSAQNTEMPLLTEGAETQGAVVLSV